MFSMEKRYRNKIIIIIIMVDLQKVCDDIWLNTVDWWEVEDGGVCVNTGDPELKSVNKSGVSWLLALLFRLLTDLI